MKIAKPIPYSPTFKGGFAGVAGRAVTAIALSMFNAPFTVEAEESKTMTPRQNLSTRQEAIPTIAAFTAMGNLPQLNVALKEGLDAELTISETKEVLVQMYAYTGFPRSLNALAELMKVLSEPRQRPASVRGVEVSTSMMEQSQRGPVRQFSERQPSSRPSRRSPPA